MKKTFIHNYDLTNFRQCDFWGSANILSKKYLHVDGENPIKGCSRNFFTAALLQCFIKIAQIFIALGCIGMFYCCFLQISTIDLMINRTTEVQPVGKLAKKYGTRYILVRPTHPFFCLKYSKKIILNISILLMRWPYDKVRE